MAFWSMRCLMTVVCCMALTVIACIGLGTGVYNLQVHIIPCCHCSLPEDEHAPILVSPLKMHWRRLEESPYWCLSTCHLYGVKGSFWKAMQCALYI